ncbi:MAG TPA: bacillithiol biosynthesis cysteine-adding enzyme BshC [Candidatus Acidoferrales bacterium]|nr:bacillithiol biosynthesis cysteine-adding enzyme BshC [Candidatus Acidoferrales bacterium]
MDSRVLTFRQLPHQPKLFLEYLDHFEKVKSFYFHPPSMPAVTRSARKLDYPGERRAEVSSILRRQNVDLGAGAETLANLDRLQEGAVAVVSGQQVGLFSGPAYSVYKALTAVQIAEELTRGGIPAVPIFWMATEDHDLDEVRHASWFEQGKLIRFELPLIAETGRPVGRISLGTQIEPLVQAAAELLAKQGSDLLAQYLVESYRPEETYGSAFGKLFARLFAQQGLILMDPLDNGLHKVAAPLYQHALAERDALNEKLLQRGKDLDRAGFDAQVKVTSRSTLLFRLADGVREVITASNGKFQAGEKTWHREELVHLTHTEPENFSPNALFRPVVQDYLLPTAAYIAGPAEISYFAQSEVVYRHLLGRMPVMLPRAGFTLVDAKADKLLRRYGLTVENVWGGPQELRHKMESRSVPGSLAKNFERNQKQIAKMLAQLGKQIEKLDPTLKGTVERARKRIEFHIDKLRRKAGRAQDKKAGLISAHEQYLESLLDPHKGLQERELCLLPFLARWGAGGLSELQKLSTGKKIGHHFIIQLP